MLLGTVKGDIHDIGKDIVNFMLDVNGFQVTDLGVDVPIATFVEKIKELQPPVVALSGFLTLAYTSMKDTVEAIDGGRAARPGQDHDRRRHDGSAGLRLRRGRRLRQGRDVGGGAGRSSGRRPTNMTTFIDPDLPASPPSNCSASA